MTLDWITVQVLDFLLENMKKIQLMTYLPKV